MLFGVRVIRFGFSVISLVSGVVGFGFGVGGLGTATGLGFASLGFGDCICSGPRVAHSLTGLF